jgi:hypothetical protein
MSPPQPRHQGERGRAEQRPGHDGANPRAGEPEMGEVLREQCTGEAVREPADESGSDDRPGGVRGRHCRVLSSAVVDTANARLTGRVVVVAQADTASGAELARSMTDDGAAVVLVGDDAGALGRVAAALLADGARCAIFVGDPRDSLERRALAELVSELFG